MKAAIHSIHTPESSSKPAKGCLVKALLAIGVVLLACIGTVFFRTPIFNLLQDSTPINRQDCASVYMAFEHALARNQIELAQSLVVEQEHERLEEWMKKNGGMKYPTGLIDTLVDDGVWQSSSSRTQNGEIDFSVYEASGNSYLKVDGIATPEPDSYCRISKWSAFLTSY